MAGAGGASGVSVIAGVGSGSGSTGFSGVPSNIATYRTLFSAILDTVPLYSAVTV